MTKPMPKLNFEEALDRLDNQQYLTADAVSAAALNRKVWFASNYYPGCLPDSSSVCRTKADAIETCLMIADDGEGPPWGMKTALQKREFFDTPGGYRYSIEQLTLKEVLR